MMSNSLPTSPRKQRLDLAVVERGLVETRSRARAMILAGDVLVDNRVVTRAGEPVTRDQHVALADRPVYVSRGGTKLEHAFNVFGLDIRDLVCADFGASTGGFTDVLLQRGATRVYAIDVGYGQLAWEIRTDSRVVTIERTNARYLEELPEPVDVIVIDVSFISLRHMLPVAHRLLVNGGICVPLIKPQFEAGRSDVGKGGVVKDEAVHRRVLETVLTDLSGFSVDGLTRSPIRGPAGNVEFFACLRVGGERAKKADLNELIDSTLAEQT